MNCYIFDLDGTLLNTLNDLAASVNYALNEAHLPTRTVEEVRFMVGNGVEKLIRRAVPANTEESVIAEVLSSFRSYYVQHSEDTTVPYPGIQDLLQTLRANGATIAVVSNKFDKATKALCDKYFPGLINLAVGENEAEGIRKKPAPDMVLDVISKLSIDKSCDRDKCVYIGDSDVDIETAKNAGIKCLSVLWGFRDRDFLIAHGAETFIESPSEILRY